MKMIKILICLLLTAIAFFSATASAVSGYIRGDVDSDGLITVSDATLIQRVLVQIPVQSYNAKAADVNGDGLDISDATRIQRYLAEFNDPYHIGEFVITPLPTEDEYELPLVPTR